MKWPLYSTEIESIRSYTSIELAQTWHHIPQLSLLIMLLSKEKQVGIELHVHYRKQDT